MISIRNILFFVMIYGSLNGEEPKGSPSIKDKIESTLSDNPFLTAGAVGTAASGFGAVGGVVLMGASPLAARAASHLTDKVFSYSDRILDKSVEGHLKNQDDSQKEAQKIQEKGYRDTSSLHYFHALDQKSKKKPSFWMSKAEKETIKLENAARDLLMSHAKDLPGFQKHNRKALKKIHEKLKISQKEGAPSKKSDNQKKNKLQILQKSLQHGENFVKKGFLPSSSSEDVILFERRNDRYLEEVLKKYRLPADKAGEVLDKAKSLRENQSKTEGLTRAHRSTKG